MFAGTFGSPSFFQKGGDSYVDFIFFQGRAKINIE